MLVWYRMLLSSLAILGIFYYRKSLPKISRREIFMIGSIGFLVMLHWVFFYGSIKASSISVAMICLSAIALFSSILEPLINKAPFDFIEILFSAMAVTGISTIYNSDVSASTGIILGLISAFLSSLFSTFNKRIATKYESLTISFIELSFGFGFLTILLPVYFLFCFILFQALYAEESEMLKVTNVRKSVTATSESTFIPAKAGLSSL